MTLPCSQLDEFFDGELAADAAAAFRAHLATCDRCQRQLSGRMQEAMVVDEAAPVADEVVPIARARERKAGNTRAYAIAGAVLAVAAAAAFVWSWRREAHKAPFELAMTIQRGATHYMGTEAHVGDTVHLETTDAIWIFRDDRELVLACPGGAGCSSHGADLEILRHGSYSIVLLEGGVLPAPSGNLDSDVAAAKARGAMYKMIPFEVR